MDARSSDDRAEDDDRGTRDRGTRALYARHVVRRGRVDLPWSPDERAVAPLLGGVATFPRLAGEALARRALKTRELYLYHSGRATARTSFSLPDDALRLVFDALARVSVEKAGPEPDGWDRDEALFTAVLRSVWVEKFSLMSAIDVVKATVPLARVSKSWRDALREAVQLRHELFDQYKRELSERGGIIFELQHLYHSQWPISSDSSDSSEFFDPEEDPEEAEREAYRNRVFDPERDDPETFRGRYHDPDDSDDDAFMASATGGGYMGH